MQEEKLKGYKQALNQIKESTGVTDVNEIIQKFQTQNHTISHLKDMQTENDRKINNLTDELNELKKALEKVKFESMEGMT